MEYFAESDIASSYYALNQGGLSEPNIGLSSDAFGIAIFYCGIKMIIIRFFCKICPKQCVFFVVNV